MQRILAVVGTLLVWAGPLALAQDTNINGHWDGVATFSGADLPFEVDFSSASTSGTSGVLSFKTLPASRLPLTNILTSSGLGFTLATDGGPADFVGTRSGDIVTGSWKILGVDASVSMHRSVASPLSFHERQITCANGDVRLSGTLLTPQSRTSPHPLMVFLHGSGDAPRQQFRFLAEHFVGLGYASFIFDKRGSGESTGDWRRATFDDLASDALSCIVALKTASDVDTDHIGLLGQSQGGWVAPLVASKTRDVRFMVLVSGTPITPARQRWWGTEVLLRQRGFGQDAVDKAVGLMKADDEVTRTTRGSAEVQAAIGRVREESWFMAVPVQATPEPMRPFLRGIIDFDPLPLLDTLTLPSLWLYGAADTTVPARDSAAVLEGLRTRGKNLTIVTFPDADHALWVFPKGTFAWPRLATGYLSTMDSWVEQLAASPN